MSQDFAHKTFLISRTDSIGDVVLTLPLCGWIKRHIPGARIVFLGKTYTRAIIESCPDVDAFLNWDELRAEAPDRQVEILRSHHLDVVLHVFPQAQIAWLCKRTGIAHRIGTRNRWFHWLTCNRLVALSRRHSPLHESQLNLSLLRPLGLVQLPEISRMSDYLHLESAAPLPAGLQALLQPGRPHVILHPKSQGSAREWELEKFGLLARRLHQQGYQVFVSGTAKDQELMAPWLEAHRGCLTDITGRLTLPEFVAFINACEGLVAASTGPLHIAAALGIHALGLYPPMKPIHPGRWAPLGAKAEFLVLEKDCQDCRRQPASCHCIRQLSVEAVFQRIQDWNLLPPARS
ncbi:MAG: glycosyltransferase family 9 protein [Adhaeribacter sp.]